MPRGLCFCQGVSFLALGVKSCVKVGSRDGVKDGEEKGMRHEWEETVH